MHVFYLFTHFTYPTERVTSQYVRACVCVLPCVQGRSLLEKACLRP